MEFKPTKFDDGEQKLLYAHIKGTNVGRGDGKRNKQVSFWRFHHQDGDEEPRGVGPEYSSEKKLLADLDRFGAEFGFEMSMAEKMGRAFQLALELCYEGEGCIHARDLEALFGEELSSHIWGWADGLVQKYHMKIMRGECSLQATIDYDVAEAEASIDADIVKFLELKERLACSPTSTATPTTQ